MEPENFALELPNIQIRHNVLFNLFFHIHNKIEGFEFNHGVDYCKWDSYTFQELDEGEQKEIKAYCTKMESFEKSTTPEIFFGMIKNQSIFDICKELHIQQSSLNDCDFVVEKLLKKIIIEEDVETSEKYKGVFTNFVDLFLNENHDLSKIFDYIVDNNGLKDNMSDFIETILYKMHQKKVSISDKTLNKVLSSDLISKNKNVLFFLKLCLTEDQKNTIDQKFIVN